MGEGMKTFEFQDINQTKICVQYSGAGDIRVYITPLKAKDSKCIHMTPNQAQILICAIQDLLDARE